MAIIQSQLCPWTLDIDGITTSSNIFKNAIQSVNLKTRRLTAKAEDLSVFVRRQNLVDLKLPELRETLAHQVVLMLITVMHLLAERQGL